MSIKESVTPKSVVDLLNRALAKDAGAINNLVASRVICNNFMADDPTIQVGKRPEGGYRVGLLGILNGIFGTDDDTGYGPLGAEFDKETGLIEKFVLTDFDKVKIRQGVKVNNENRS